MQTDTTAMWKEINAKEQELSRIVAPARKAFEAEVAASVGAQSAWSGHFGATGIDPKHLFVYFVVPARAQSEALASSDAWSQIRSRLFDRLMANGYPVLSLQSDWLGIFSQQACDEDFGGNWYHFFK